MQYISQEFRTYLTMKMAVLNLLITINFKQRKWGWEERKKRKKNGVMLILVRKSIIINIYLHERQLRLIVLRHTAWMTVFSCNKLNLCFDPLPLVRFWWNLAFWKAFNIRKRTAQVLRKKLQIFCKQPVKGNLHIFSFSCLRRITILQIRFS